jgi:HAD superfamily hydrolase (TIGR01509 family)
MHTMIQGLVFDFDGLLLDTERYAYEAWLEIYREYGHPFPISRWSEFLGGSGWDFDPCTYLAEQVGQPFDVAAVRARRWQRKTEMCSALEFLPGVADYLTAAKRLDLKLGVASNSSRSWVVGHLDRLGVTRVFDTIVTADDVERLKPDPEIYRTAVAALGLRPEQVIALEDSPTGLFAAKRAGLVGVAVPNPITADLPLDHADLRITSLADVPLECLLLMVQERLGEQTVR